MEIIKECGVCGKEFVASKMSFKYCCRGCERVAFRRREAEKKKREKENAESLRNAERNNFLREKAFLSPEDVSVLFNDSLPTVYRYFQTGLIKAVKIRNKTFVRYSDI
ncbi:MAG: helix-turn-helix domain-containing protein [Prevotella sp.]|nr:helix-turn-helix domain-containing protein [Prevotella sp.]